MRENEVWAFDSSSSALPELHKPGWRHFQSVDTLLSEADEVKVLPRLVLADLSSLSVENQLATVRVLASLPVPLLVVCESDDSQFLENCYSEGAADFVLKPLREGELQARIDHLLASKGHTATELAPAVAKQGVGIDPLSLTIVRGERRTPSLTSKEFQIATYLCHSTEPTVSRSEMVRRLWGNTSVSPKTLDVHIYNLRKKLASLGILVRQAPPGAFVLEFEPLPATAATLSLTNF